MTGRAIRAAILLAACLTSAVGPALAASSSKPRPKPLPRPAIVVAPEPVKVRQSPAPLVLPSLMTTGDAGPRCRAQCSTPRYVCLSGGDAQDCDPAWNRCLRACSRPLNPPLSQARQIP